MKYPHLDKLPELIEQKLITKREHPRLPLSIYNYSASAQFLPLQQWTEPMKDCRGLILDSQGEIVGRPFRKFWNYEQVLDQIPVGEEFTVWEKLDGSLGVVCWYGADLVVATRGSFESDQARWAQNHLKYAGDIKPGFTYLFEIIFPENRIVVDYGDRRDMPLLAVLDANGNDHPAFEDWPASKARRFDGLTELNKLAALAYPGEEGFVVRWSSGFRAKVKFEEYKRLHRLITQCSTRTIWDLLRNGKDTAELLERVPSEFGQWVRDQIRQMTEQHNGILDWAHGRFNQAPKQGDRKAFAEFAKKEDRPNLLFLLYDGKPIEEQAWKIVEPKWTTPFKGEIE